MAGRMAARFVAARRNEYFGQRQEQPRFENFSQRPAQPRFQSRPASSVVAGQASRALRGHEYFGHTLDKTRLCKYFEQGRCVHGSRCTFAHGIGELQLQPDFYRSQLCVEYMQSGTCHYGVGCRFAHGPEQLRAAGARGDAHHAAESTWVPPPPLFFGSAAAVSSVAIPQPPPQQQEPRRQEESPEDEERRLKQELEMMQRQARYLAAQLEGAGGPPATEPWLCEGPGPTLLGRRSMVIEPVATKDEASRRYEESNGSTATCGGSVGEAVGDGSRDATPKLLLSERDALSDALSADVRVTVKNTFVEVDDTEPTPAPLRHVKSAPSLGEGAPHPSPA